MLVLDKPLVSIVIPTYKHGHLIGRALQSVIDQTYQNWEAIVIDNYSPDDTDTVVLGFADPRIKLLKIHNEGVIAASRNRGIFEAQGSWLAFLDSDDLWYPTKIETVITRIEQGEVADVYCNDELLSDEKTGGKQRLRYGPYCSHFYKAMLTEGNRLSVSATVIKRSFLVAQNILFRENKEFIGAEDYDFWMLLAKAGAKFKFINLVQGEYIIHDTNVSASEARSTQNSINVKRDHVFNLQTFQQDKAKLWRSINAGILMGDALKQLNGRHYLDAIKSIIHAITSSCYGSIRWIAARTKHKATSVILRLIGR